jgi:hypothetical protein
VSFEIGKQVWQSRFHLELVQGCERVIHYIHNNPVREKLCCVPEEYPWSSASGRWDIHELSML